MKKIVRYYGWARNHKGQIEQVLVEVVPDSKTCQRFTGHIYKSDRAAATETERLNIHLGFAVRHTESRGA